MSSLEVNRFATDRELAWAVADRWISDLCRLGSSQPYSVALSGGRITEQFFFAVVEQCKTRSYSPEQIHFFWADERCVPPEDPASSFGVAQRLLFEPLNVRAEWIHRIRGETEKESAVAGANEDIRRIVPLNGDQQPTFDMVFLGMGEDGHVASLFPGEPEQVASGPEIYRAVCAVKPPPIRITLGYKAIAAAKRVWVLASGKGKEEALHKSLQQNGQTPLGRILGMRDQTVIFTDIPETILPINRPKLCISSA
ncbi:MAG: 6-phosphogluconolactonase [Verrucomicrobia bacterium]|nr:6-phosphogluconolactonase [Verrucomicrobiota bacterium]